MKNKLLGILMVAVSLSIIIYAFPQFMAHAWMAVGTDIYYRLPTGKVTEKEIEAFIESREKAIEWADLHKAKTDLTILPLVSEAHRFQAFTAAEELKQLLVQNPNDGFLWVRLSDLQERIAAPVSEILASWRTSYQYMPYEPRVAYVRLYRALRFDEYLTADDKALVEKELEGAYKLNRHSLRNQIRRYKLQAAVDEYIKNEEMRAFLLA